jgi:hypothetical protein
MDQMKDLVLTTRAAMPSGKLVFSQKYQNYPIMDKWFGGSGQEKKIVKGGDSIKETLSLKDTGQAEMVLPAERRSYAGEDVLTEMVMDWVRCETHYTILMDELDAHVDPWRNRGGEGVVDLIESKRANASMSAANLLEERAWELPESDRNARNAAGIPYWVVKRTDDGFGFDGGSALGTGQTAGITLADYPRYQNFAVRGADYYTRPTDDATYPTIDENLIDALTLIHEKCNFQVPVTVQQYVDDIVLQNQSIYLNTYTKIALQRYMRTNRDDARASGELNWIDGNLMFMRRPLQVVTALDDATDGSGYPDFPIYFIDHGHFHVIVHAGREFHEYNTIIPSDRPDVLVNLVYTKFQYFCKNRQRQGVISAVTAV